MSDGHNASGQYGHFYGGEDRMTGEDVEHLREFHDKAEAGHFTCEQCGRNVHCFSGPRGGFNEQVYSYIRYGPYFVCVVCVSWTRSTSRKSRMLAGGGRC